MESPGPLPVLGRQRDPVQFETIPKTGSVYHFLAPDFSNGIVTTIGDLGPAANWTFDYDADTGVWGSQTNCTISVKNAGNTYFAHPQPNDPTAPVALIQTNVIDSTFFWTLTNGSVSYVPYGCALVSPFTRPSVCLSSSPAGVLSWISSNGLRPDQSAVNAEAAWCGSWIFHPSPRAAGDA